MLSKNSQVESNRICRALLCKSLKGLISFKVDVSFVVINVLGSRYHETFMNVMAVGCQRYDLCFVISFPWRSFEFFCSPRAVTTRISTI